MLPVQQKHIYRAVYSDLLDGHCVFIKFMNSCLKFNMQKVSGGFKRETGPTPPKICPYLAKKNYEI